MAAFSDLSTDLIHEIFVQISDFNMLLAATLVCKKHRQIFQDHPKSIMRAAVKNLLGAAFTAAARLAVHKDNYDHYSKLPSEEHFNDIDWVPPKHLQPSLEKLANSSRILRDFYSQR